MCAGPIEDRERADARRNRERILRVTARLIGENGVEQVSMDQIAAAAGVGKGTLYRRFGDRASLLRALVSESDRELQEALIHGDPPLGPGAPAAERLRAFGVCALRLLDGRAPLMREAESTGEGWCTTAVYAFYRTHVRLLLRDALDEHAPVDYLADCLLAPLGAEPFLCQRVTRGMSLSEVIAGWCALAAAILATQGSAAR